MTQRQQAKAQQQKQQKSSSSSSSFVEPKSTTSGVGDKKLNVRQQVAKNNLLPHVGASYLNQRQGYFFKSTPYGSCGWMSLQDFKKVSLDNGETIIRDSQDQPSYILSMRAYLMWNNSAYIPLNNLKVLSSIIKFDGPNDGASVQSLPLNCSFVVNDNAPGQASSNNNAFTSLLVPIQNQNRPFKEEIIILVDCGYLVLETYGDGAFLSLNTISFHQNIKPPSVINEERSGKSFIDTESQGHLVFSSSSSNNSSTPSSSSNNVPLLTIPLISRYICENRVILNGSQSIQLVLDRFELQRLTYPIETKLNITDEQATKNEDNSFGNVSGHVNQHHSVYKRATGQNMKSNGNYAQKIYFTAGK